MPAKALDAADMLASRLADQYPRPSTGLESLKSLYLNADTVRGEARFRHAVQLYDSTLAASSPISHDSPGLLSGKFLDIASGDTIDLGSYHGKVVVMEFWTTWCGGCIVDIPFLKSYAKSLESEENAEFISVVCDITTWNQSEQYISNFVEAQGITYVVLVDQKNDPLWRRFNIPWFPARLIIDRDGGIALTPEDAGDWSKVKERIAMLGSRSGGHDARKKD
jgi:thiol-disulfide isomerase/thioredoxin